MTLSVELIVIDNGSADQTPQVVQEYTIPNVPIIYLSEQIPGQCRAYNTALKAAQGEILLFTDDDVRPPPDWVQQMCQPIIVGSADAVAGGVRLSPHLKRPWMSVDHVDWLASTENVERDTQIALIGANMAISRKILEKVPQFDEETGPGAIGHASDTLFSFQIEKAGYRIARALDIVVEHHLMESRLSRKAFARQARKRGEFNAYVAHHWSHFTPRHPYLRLLRVSRWLWLARLKRLPDWITAPTVPAWELPLLEAVHTERCFLQERKRPRNYEKHGLVKRNIRKEAASL